MAEVIEFIPRLPTDASASDAVSRLSVIQMRAVWDAWVGGGPLDYAEIDPGCYILEAIHAEMNERGEGRQVAV